MLEINIFVISRLRWKLCDEKNPEAKNLVTLYLLVECVFDSFD
jgi:hypothetical protein